jgi:hypothetical protein
LFYYSTKLFGIVKSIKTTFGMSAGWMFSQVLRSTSELFDELFRVGFVNEEVIHKKRKQSFAIVPYFKKLFVILCFF